MVSAVFNLSLIPPRKYWKRPLSKTRLIQNVAYALENEQHRGTQLGKIQIAFVFAVLLKCLTLSWMKQHAQKFPACNLNGARAFHMKRNLFGDFGRPVRVSGCMKESVLRVSWEKTCPGNTELNNKMSLMIKEWHNLSLIYVLKSKRQIVDFP